jgi:hypothetical protein
LVTGRVEHGWGAVIERPAAELPQIGEALRRLREWKLWGSKSRAALPVPSRGGVVFVDEAAEDRAANYL